MVQSIKRQIFERYYNKYIKINADLTERITSQIRYDIFEEFSNRHIPDNKIDIMNFAGWSSTKERDLFWNELYNLEQREMLTIENIEAVYKKYTIPFVPDIITYETWYTH